MNFNDLNLSKPLLNALADIGYEQPTPIQEKAFPIIMSGKSAVCIAQTGTGKTFAYLLPLLRSLAYSEQRQPRILIVVPTRELVLQVVAEIEKLTAYMNVRTYGVYGGVNMNTQKETVYSGADVIVATPGRLIDLALTSVLRLRSIQKLVIDEVDEMLNLGFRAQLVNLIDMLPAKRQNLLFSATLSSDVENFIKVYFDFLHSIEVVNRGTPLEKIYQKAYHVPNFYTKVNLLKHLLSSINEMNKIVVFVKDKRWGDQLYRVIESEFSGEIDIIHSNKSQSQRNNAVKEFEEGKCRILIATDIIARGLDIKDVTHVINFDTPEKPGDYIHRIGRTGRADKQGEAITFVTENEQALVTEIEKLMNVSIPLESFPAEVKISHELTDEEDPDLFDKNYMKIHSNKNSQGAFHEKKDKNKKINLGGPHKRDPRKGSVAKGRRKKKRRF